jgi:hypothetical protein
VLAAYGHAELIDRCGAFSTPFELSVAAECADELGREATPAELLDTYVDQRLHGAAVSRGALRQIASHMFTDLRPFPRRGEVTQRLRRQMKLSDEQIQSLYDCDLLTLSRGRIAFRHEQCELFLATEALLSDDQDIEEVARRLNAPRAAGLRRHAMALEGDRDRLETMLALCEDAGVLVDAGLGLLGTDAAEAVDGVFAETLSDACARTTAPGIALQLTGDEFHGCRWQIPAPATAAQNAALSAIGQLMHHGRFTDQVDTLIRHTDDLVARAVNEVEPKIRARVADQVFAATYAFDHSAGLPANPLMMAVIHRGFSVRPDRDTVAEIITRLVGDDAEQAGLGAIWLAAHLMHDPRVPIRADIVIRCLQAGPYHMRLFGLTVAEDRGRRFTAAARRCVIDAVEALPTNNIMLNSSISEALSSLGALEPIKTAEDIEAEIEAVLAMQGNPTADQMAYGIVSTQFEADLLGPYYQVISDLPADDRIQLLAMGLNGSEHSFLTDDWILDEIEDLSAPQARDAVVAWVARADPKDWMSSQHGMSATVTSLTLLAAAGLSVPASSNGERAPEWEAALALMMIAGSSDAEETSEGWRQFAAEHPRSLASLVINLHSIDRWNRDRSLLDRLEAAIPAEVVPALVNVLEHPEQATSIVRWDHDLRRDVVRALGRLGNRAAAGVLRRFADDPNIGESVADAVRAIEGRAT